MVGGAMDGNGPSGDFDLPNVSSPPIIMDVR
jgi:hypothetical protein